MTVLSSKLFVSNAPTQNKNVLTSDIQQGDAQLCMHLFLFRLFSNFKVIVWLKVSFRDFLSRSKRSFYQNSEKQWRPPLVKSEFKESLKCSHARSVVEMFLGSGREKKKNGENIDFLAIRKRMECFSFSLEG